MIETPKEADRGKALLEKYEAAITAMCKLRKESALTGKSYERLKTLCTGMDAYINNESDNVNTFISDIAPPTIRKAYIEFSALFSKFLETPPIFSVKTGDNERNSKLTGLISSNLDKTNYYDDCLFWNLDHLIRYGTTGTYSYLVDDFGNGSMQAKKNLDYDVVESAKSSGELAVVNMPIHPLNIIIDGRATYATKPDYIGFVSDINLANLSKLVGNKAYNQKNLREAIAAVKKGAPDAHWYCGEDKNISDFSQGHGSIAYFWMKLNFERNEGDPTWYAIEMVAEKIIRIDATDYTVDSLPVNIARTMPSPYDWFGSSMLLDKVCIQNAQYFMVNAMVESTAKQMDRLIILRDGGLDMPAINQRKTRDGFVTYRGDEPDLSKLVHPVPIQNLAFREQDWLTQEMRRQDADTSAMPNFNPQSAGGPGGGGQTLGGQQIVASIGELKTSFVVKQIASGLKQTAKSNLMLFFYGMVEDQIVVNDKLIVTKKDFIGSTSYSCNISNVFNYAREAIDSSNRTNMVINRMATKVPQFQTIRLAPFIKDELRNALKQENIDDYLDSEALTALDDMQINNAKQSAQPQPPQPAAGQAMPGAPAAPPQPPQGVPSV